MQPIPGEATPIERVLVATDRSVTANRAVRWAANFAQSYGADLVLLRVMVPPAGDEQTDGWDARVAEAGEDLVAFAREVAGSRGRSRVIVHDDPADAVLQAVEEERIDVVVVGNVGMSGRKEFLLGNIPNRVSHNARCTVIIVNTAGPDGARTAVPRQTELATTSEGALLGRAWRIGRILLRVGVQEIRAQRRGEEGQHTAERLRAALDELGPTFAKLGQILSTRPDLLPPAFIDELASLQEHVTPLTEAEVVAAMERELGVPWEDVFESIDPVPLAAGTIAQVHRARLESGERVVVKIQRPTAQNDILEDLGLLELFAQRAGRRPAFRNTFDLPAIIEHLSTSLRRELDFRQEAANMRHMAETLTEFPRLGVPTVYEEYSTARLLVMQEIEGTSIHEAPDGPARQEAARQLLEAYYHGVMTEGFFHADPHPGNMKWWNDRIYFLDLGMVGEVDAEVRRLILLLMLAFAQKDAAFLAEVVLMLATSRGNVDLTGFEDDIAQLVSRYRNLSIKELHLGPLLQEITQIAIRHTIRLPATLTLTGKAFAQMQLVAAELDPTADPFAVAQSYILRNTLRGLAGRLDPTNIFYETQKLQFRLLRTLEAVEGVVGARPGSNLQVDIRTTERLESTVALASRRLSLALGLSGTLVVTAVTAGSDRIPRWVPATMSGIGSTLAAALLLDRSRRRS